MPQVRATSKTEHRDNRLLFTPLTDFRAKNVHFIFNQISLNIRVGPHWRKSCLSYQKICHRTCIGFASATHLSTIFKMSRMYQMSKIPPSAQRPWPSSGPHQNITKCQKNY